MKKLMVVLTVVALVVVGAQAAMADVSLTNSAGQDSSAPGWGGGMGRGGCGPGAKAGLGGVMKADMEDIAKILGLSAEDLQERLQAGECLEDILEEKGLTREEFHQQMLPYAKERLDAAVEQGQLSQDKADAIWERMQQGPGPQGFKGQGGRMMIGGNMLEDAAKILGLSAEDLKERLQAGETLEDIAEEKGLTLEELHQQMLPYMKERLDEAVEQGKLTQDKADAIWERMQEGPGTGPKGFKGQGFRMKIGGQGCLNGQSL